MKLRRIKTLRSMQSLHWISGILLALALGHWGVLAIRVVQGSRVFGLDGVRSAVSLDAANLAPVLASSWRGVLIVEGMAIAFTVLYGLLFYFSRNDRR